MVEAMQGGGINGLGMLSQIQSNTNDLNQQVTANLDQQYINNENKKAEGEAMVMQMQERREEADLAGLGNAMATAQNNSNQALSSAINGAMTTVASVAGMSQNQQMLNNMKGGVTNGLNLNNIAPNNGVEVVRTEIPISSSVTPQGTMANMPQQQGYYPSPNNILNPSIPYDPLRSAGFYNTFQKFRNRGV